jgi:inhibitor of KinA
MTAAACDVRFLDAGETALVVEFGTRVDPSINALVLALDRDLADRELEGIIESVPTYRSLMVHYNPFLIARGDLVRQVEELLATSSGEPVVGRNWEIPCCYDGQHGEDLDDIARTLGIGREDAIAHHAGATFRVYMCGFAPGFTYLGGLPEALHISRRESPRPPHAAGAVLVGGGLATIASFAMPTGWYVIGQTPERLYAPERQDAFLLSPGDTVRFRRIGVDEFDVLEAQAATAAVISRTFP